MRTGAPSTDNEIEIAGRTRLDAMPCAPGDTVRLGDPDAACGEPPVFLFPIARTGALRALHEQRDKSPKLLSVVAPIGYGKTVLLSVHYYEGMRSQKACWWFSHDDRDTTIDRLLRYLEARLDASSSEHSVFDALQLMHEGNVPPDDRIDRIVRRMHHLPVPVTLFIDNVNYCEDPALTDLLAGLVFRTPSWFRLVLSSSEALPVEMVRCKLEGLVVELGTADLGLDAIGVREMFGDALCAKLSGKAIDNVVRHTEGWPAAVRLMQILLESSPDPETTLAGFSGADQDLATLLNSQVLRGFDPGLRAFLLKLSLLRDFDASLAEEATGDADAADHLLYLWKHNVFLIPVEGRQRFRLHNLFREYLMNQAAQGISVHERRAILARAAKCCERQKHCADAIDYALAASQAPMAAGILEYSAPVFVRDLGYLHRYLAWVEQLHALGEHGGWETDCWYVWALVFGRRYELARQEIARLMKRLQQAGEEGTANRADLARIARRIDVIHLAIDVYTDHLATVTEHARRWLAVAERDGATMLDAPFDVATVACAGAIHDVNECRLADARYLTRIAFASIAQSNSAYGQAWVAAVNALIPMREGDYAAAYPELTEALQQAGRELGNTAGICSTIALLAAKCAIEMDLREEAGQLLDRGLRKAISHGIVETTAHGLDAAVKMWSGQDSDSIGLPALRKIASVYPARLSMMLSCFITRRLLQLGRIDEALHEAATLGIGQPGDTMSVSVEHAVDDASLRDLIDATISDLLIASGKFKQAGALIGEETVRARTAGRSGRLVELALNQALLSHCMHDPVAAARHLTRAISLAARRRYLRPFRDRMDLIAGLVNDTRPKDWPFVTEEERRFFTDLCSGLKVTGNPVLEQIQALDSNGMVGETPTVRELELLGLIDAGLSNQEIADRLSLSVATVKWHLYNLYTKLGVKNRASALARARSLNLLTR
ncbi:LuxR C-terminal-related transcriptional regulator [Burkholderia sp. Ac-20353]|uniref:LuxR C-terminal-related transcriptional regulator n=1 Tax=Burkholderia sp. Ac-20353 TaxID=2703894 RepID=UPI00197B35FD